MTTDTRTVNIPVITLDWYKTHQVIEGFGAFAGRARPLFESRHRDTFMDLLWGKQGLQLNMIRGKIFHTYPYDESGVVTIKPAGVDIDRLHVTSDEYQALTTQGEKNYEYSPKDRVAQLWILKNGLEKMKEHCQAPIVFASAWTPPLEMKERNTLHAHGYNNINFHKYPDIFARYLAGFAKAHEDEGVPLYAISPSNEPENIIADWDACYWTPGDLGRFIANNLRPYLSEDTKIIASENAAWIGNNAIPVNTANSFLSKMDDEHRKVVNILAGHGYAPLPDVIWGKKGLNQSPSAWKRVTASRDQSVWMTEASDAGVDHYDGTMKGGMRLAITMHEFLTECSVNAYVFWLAVLKDVNSESLLATHSEDKFIAYSKAYYVMGQYSRHVRPGYRRFECEVANKATELRASAYRDPETGHFSVVVLNPGDTETFARIDLSGFTAGSLKPYLTSDRADEHWHQGPDIDPEADKNYVVKVPPFSVITFTGAGAGI